MTILHRVLSRPLLAALLAITALTGVSAPATLLAQSAPEPLSAFPQSLLAIRTSTGRVINFKIWTADRPSRQEQGLMFVKEMDEHAGMLFVFPAPDRISMWMKNTYISLDMVFIDSKGRIDYIAERTTPMSLDIIQAPRPIQAVLELNGGAAEHFGIHAGDRVLHKSFAAPH